MLLHHVNESWPQLFPPFQKVLPQKNKSILFLRYNELAHCSLIAY